MDKRKPTLGFDVYGTLIDTAGVFHMLQDKVGEKAAEFTARWRDKQLEYSFRRGVMMNYRPFSECIRTALLHTNQLMETELSEASLTALTEAYSDLPAFEDSAPALSELKENFRLFAFSNGTSDAVSNLLQKADLLKFFEDVVSVDDIKMFKPSPAVYAYFMRKAGSTGKENWLISGNPFDVIGAMSAGMNSAWVQRSPKALFDPWEIQPTLTVSALTELNQALQKYSYTE